MAKRVRLKFEKFNKVFRDFEGNPLVKNGVYWDSPARERQRMLLDVKDRVLCRVVEITTDSLLLSYQDGINRRFYENQAQEYSKYLVRQISSSLDERLESEKARVRWLREALKNNPYYESPSGGFLLDNFLIKSIFLSLYHRNI